jgi:hypothetical protein
MVYHILLETCRKWVPSVRLGHVGDLQKLLRLLDSLVVVASQVCMDDWPSHLTQPFGIEASDFPQVITRILV